jgi:Arc/MetJ-type ribon-helix-helix transcriptional regulator
MESSGMGHALTEAQKALIRDLLEVGRWNNESEIIRYGLHLVAKEVETDASRGFELKPYRSGVLARAYKKLSKADRQDESAMERASAKPRAGELG